jgi:hypothetical protein
MQMLLLNIYKYLFTSMKHNVSSNRKQTIKRQEDMLLLGLVWVYGV